MGSVTHKTMQATQRIDAYLSLTVIDQDEDTGDFLVSVLPIPHKLMTVITWLLLGAVSVVQAMAQVQMKAGWLASDVKESLRVPAGWLVQPVKYPFADGAVRFYVAVTTIEVVIRTLLWAIQPQQFNGNLR